MGQGAAQQRLVGEGVSEFFFQCVQKAVPGKVRRTAAA
jgi:hypothetical protein